MYTKISQPGSICISYQQLLKSSSLKSFLPNLSTVFPKSPPLQKCVGVPWSPGEDQPVRDGKTPLCHRLLPSWTRWQAGPSQMDGVGVSPPGQDRKKKSTPINNQLNDMIFFHGVCFPGCVHQQERRLVLWRHSVGDSHFCQRTTARGGR